MSSELHPDGKLNPSQVVSNDSDNDSIIDLIEQRGLSRRSFLKTSLGATSLAVLGTGMLGGLTSHAGAAPAPTGGIGFTSVPANLYLNAAVDDAVTVPQGYTARVLVAWGDSLTMQPNWDPSGAMDEATQLHCYGAHTDGMHFFPQAGTAGNSGGLLVTNSEYCDPGLVNSTTSYATAAITIDMVRAQQAAHGVNVAKVFKNSYGNWQVNRHSPFNRRITGNTPCRSAVPPRAIRCCRPKPTRLARACWAR